MLPLATCLCVFWHPFLSDRFIERWKSNFSFFPSTFPLHSVMFFDDCRRDLVAKDGKEFKEWDLIVCRNKKETKGGRKSSINTSTTMVLLKLYVLLNVAKLPFSGEVCCSLPTTKRRSVRSSPKKLYLSLAVLPTIYTYNIYSLTHSSSQFNSNLFPF